MTTAILPTLVQQFFTDRLCTQMAASPNTIAAYRDTFRLLLQFASDKTCKPPTKLAVGEVASHSSVTFWRTLKTNAATAPGAVTPDLLRSVVSSGSWR